MKSLLIVLAFLVAGILKDDPAITPSELKILTGEKWKGSLIYKDYSNDGEVTIPSELLIIQSDTNDQYFFFSTFYPDEPHMNNTLTLVISEDGKVFDGESITQKKYLEDGSLYFTTEKEGEDNDRKAVIRHILTINKSRFSIWKEVRYDGEKEFFIRNKYEFTR